MRKTLIVCAVAALGLSATANADPSQVQERLDVPYGDLNLNNPAGAEAMMFRIRSAATQVCGGLPDMRVLHERRVFRACFRQTVAEAVEEIKSPLLAAVYEEQLAKGLI